MTEQEFKDAYIVQFAASYTAQNYDDNIMMNRHDLIRGHDIMEEAIFLSHYAWEKYCEMIDDTSLNPGAVA